MAIAFTVPKGIRGQQRPKKVSLQAQVIRANGTREPVKTVAYWHRNPLRRLLFWCALKTGRNTGVW